jgi:hypothetical protein
LIWWSRVVGPDWRQPIRTERHRFQPPSTAEATGSGPHGSQPTVEEPTRAGDTMDGGGPRATQNLTRARAAAKRGGEEDEGVAMESADDEVDALRRDPCYHHGSRGECGHHG